MRSESASCERDPCRALINAQLTEEDVATRPQVDPKTVLRWLEGSLPYLRHHWGAATMLGEDETDLWPQLRPSRTKPDEVVAIYPHRDTVPRVLWLRLTGSAQHEIGILDSIALSPASRQPIVAALAERADCAAQLATELELWVRDFEHEGHVHRSPSWLRSVPSRTCGSGAERPVRCEANPMDGRRLFDEATTVTERS